MSKSERKTFEISETKEEVFERDGWMCQVCGRSVNQSTGQLGHLIPQSKAMLDKYGKQIIHHPDNMLTTCSLRCNNAIQLNIPMMQEQLAREIRETLKNEPVG